MSVQSALQKDTSLKAFRSSVRTIDTSLVVVVIINIEPDRNASCVFSRSGGGSGGDICLLSLPFCHYRPSYVVSKCVLWPAIHVSTAERTFDLEFQEQWFRRNIPQDNQNMHSWLSTLGQTTFKVLLSETDTSGRRSGRHSDMSQAILTA